MDWLGELCQELHLPDVTLLKGRAEELSRQKEHREGYDVAVSRALAPCRCWRSSACPM